MYYLTFAIEVAIAGIKFQKRNNIPMDKQLVKDFWSMYCAGGEI